MRARVGFRVSDKGGYSWGMDRRNGNVSPRSRTRSVARRRENFGRVFDMAVSGRGKGVRATGRLRALRGLLRRARIFIKVRAPPDQWGSRKRRQASVAVP